MMSLLPPVGWADVATKQDIASVRVEMQAAKQEVINVMTWRMLVIMTSMLVGIAAILAAFVAPLYG